MKSERDIKFYNLWKIYEAVEQLKIKILHHRMSPDRRRRRRKKSEFRVCFEKKEEMKNILSDFLDVLH